MTAPANNPAGWTGGASLPSYMSPGATLWREIDALGGAVESEFDAGYAAALGRVLAILERRGFTEHADAIDAGPDLYEALAELADVFAHDGENSVDRFERLAVMFRKQTGYLAPGKDQPMCGSDQPDGDELRAIYDAWYLGKVTRARAALAKARGEAA